MLSDRYLNIGGVATTDATVLDALSVLREAPGVMVKQPLSRTGNPLAAMDYHTIARTERALFPELVLPRGTRGTPTPHEKTAVIHHLERVHRELGP
jgi:hypothetical protein